MLERAAQSERIASMRLGFYNNKDNCTTTIKASISKLSCSELHAKPGPNHEAPRTNRLPVPRISPTAASWASGTSRYPISARTLRQRSSGQVP